MVHPSSEGKARSDRQPGLRSGPLLFGAILRAFFIAAVSMGGVTAAADADSANEPPAVHQCDVLAADPWDPIRVTDGVHSRALDGASAAAACQDALQAHPETARFQYQRGRAAQNLQDFATALTMFRMAAEQDYAAAQHGLGQSYAFGLGVGHDPKEAVRWYRKAAEQDFAPAQNDLGNAFATGLGAPKDVRQAVEWFQKAARQGVAESQFALGHAYVRGTAVDQDDGQAASWFRKAAEQGYSPAQHDLAYMYESGVGVPADRDRAIHWYQMAAQNGHQNAIRRLGELGISTAPRSGSGGAASGDPRAAAGPVGWVGMRIADVEAREGDQATQYAGAYVVFVWAGGPAHQAGLQTGDVLVAVDEKAIQNAVMLAQIVVDFLPGQLVSFDFWRGGQRLRTDLIVGSRAAAGR